uniref:Uncharacterized protein n=1 Tax=Anguilla anguilla TaxID=7936 RepID=A0A0E9WJB8_ANGAN
MAILFTYLWPTSRTESEGVISCHRMVGKCFRFAQQFCNTNDNQLIIGKCV